MGKKKSFNNDYDFARESNHLTAIARERVSFDRYHATTFVLESLRERAIERPCLRVRICECILCMPAGVLAIFFA